MSVPKKLIKEIIDRLSNSVFAMDSSKLTIATDLHWAKNVIIWKLTEYKSWTRFCRVHLKMPITTVNSYTTTVNLISKFSYTEQECLIMIKALGWTRFRYSLMVVKRKMLPKNFIKKFLTYNFPSGNVQTSNHPDSDRAYGFSLPVEYADKLDTWLMHFGMSAEPGVMRKNVRHAMIKLIDAKLD